jgi:uncharacterized membrane protein
MAEAEQSHRHTMEREVVSSTFEEGKRGQHYALAIGTIAIVAGAITSIFGAPWPGGLIGGGGVIGLVAVFIYGRMRGPETGSDNNDAKKH